MQDQDSDYVPSKYSRGCGPVFFAVMLIASAIWGGALGMFVWVLDDAQTTISALDEFRPKVGSRVYSSDGELLGEFTREARQLVSLSEIPLYLQKAFIATEDDVFYEHKGVRPDAMLNALLYIARTGHIRGGSTITMQLVRNVEEVTGVSKEVTIQRKLREMIVALQLERQFTKDEILELYLNMIFLGISANGVEAASQQYFAKSVRDLTLGQCAMLAGLARAPNANQPFRNLDNAWKRRDIVLEQMLENGFISQDEFDSAVTEDLSTQIVTSDERADLIAEGKSSLPPNRFKAPYFVEEVRKFMLKNYGDEELYHGGLEIDTTIDMRLQRAAEESLLTALDEFDAKKKEYLEARNRMDEFRPVSGALICLDNRPGNEGAIRAMVGGRDFSKEQYNTVTQAHRQPGSSVKPFVWAAAIDNGYTPSTVVMDEPFVHVDAAGNVWRPKNFSGDYQGPITLRRALEKSVNIVSVKLVKDLGMPLVRSYIQRAGVNTPIDDSVGLTLGLGTHSVTPLEQCVSYSTFANGGLVYQPTMITEIRNRDGFTQPMDSLERRPPERAISAQLAYVMTHLLEGVASIYGTGARSRFLERPRAGKTGTTNDAIDVWFCGFTPDYTTVVWIGYRKPKSLGQGAPYTGGRLACPVWTQFMIAAEEGLPIRNFQPPSGVEFYTVDRNSGLKGGNFREAFLPGTQPPEQMPVFLPDEELEEFLDADIVDAFEEDLLGTF